MMKCRDSNSESRADPPGCNTGPAKCLRVGNCPSHRWKRDSADRQALPDLSDRVPVLPRCESLKREYHPPAEVVRLRLRFVPVSQGFGPEELSAGCSRRSRPKRTPTSSFHQIIWATSNDIGAGDERISDTRPQ